jgi:hypothetical protein
VDHKVKRVVIVGAVTIFAGSFLIFSMCLRAQTPTTRAPTTRAPTRQAQTGHSPTRHGAAGDWDKVSVELPVSTKLFPAGDGASIADSQCLICHSVDMVLTQPLRTAQQWTDTINKMRTAFGAPLPSDQVGMLALYLSRLDLAH